MKKLGNLAIVTAMHKDCALHVFDGEATVHTGAGNERKSFICDAMDDSCVDELIAYLNFGTPITNENIKVIGG